MLKKLFLFLGIFLFTFAQSEMIDIKEDNSEQVKILNQQISNINKELQNNILYKRYGTYLTYRNISKDLELLELELKRSQKSQKAEAIDLVRQLNNKVKIKQNELELISEYKESPIGQIIRPEEIEAIPEVSNPFLIFEAITYVKKLEENATKYEKLIVELDEVLKIIDKKLDTLVKLIEFEEDKAELQEQIELLHISKKDFEMVLEIVTTTSEVYTKRVEQIILETNNKISLQAKKTLKLAVLIAIFFIVSFLLKVALRKYLSENDRYYMVNKIINFMLVVVIVVSILFAYIDNVTYLVTILGFASAGIAIALKDWFMSIFGWLVIITSGSINVGDRIKVHKDRQELVGDVLDISLFRIAVREDITLTTYTTNRRAGRIFFVPNNYIFTEMISNYTHAGLKTVWDGIDIVLTFDSNHKKAAHIVKEIVKQYSKGHTDITRKQMSKLRDRYSLRSTSVEPRIFTFIEPYGMKISAWYLTNSYATMTLRSTICLEIIEAFRDVEDIKIAYPTQTLRYQLLENQAQNPLSFGDPKSQGEAQGMFD
ncbi:MAG: mechanosensitive ion channel [Arcobacteraceae bacterium]|jgi:small-conductance mechanosensitive channel|nr:mechanosensitive ion channel family protein [Arcobacteraceae bacterium]MDY0364347.1 mechanosensitive ion channel [Arcobacteraceae bacterium]